MMPDTVQWHDRKKGDRVSHSRHGPPKLSTFKDGVSCFRFCFCWKPLPHWSDPPNIRLQAFAHLRRSASRHTYTRHRFSTCYSQSHVHLQRRAQFEAFSRIVQMHAHRTSQWNITTLPCFCRARENSFFAFSGMQSSPRGACVAEVLGRIDPLAAGLAVHSPSFV